MKGFSSGVRFERLCQKDSGYCRCGSLWRAETVRMHCRNPRQTNAIHDISRHNQLASGHAAGLACPPMRTFSLPPTELKWKVVNPDTGSEAAPRPRF